MRKALVCLSACLAGDIPQALLAGRYDDALAYAKRRQGMFGEDFYIELQNHGIPEQLQILPGLRQIARDIGAKCVATNDVHYVSPDDAEAQDVLLCIQTQRLWTSPTACAWRATSSTSSRRKEMLRALPDDAEALETTAEIVEKCNLEIEFGKRRLPEFTAPDGMPNAAYHPQADRRWVGKKASAGG
jgi:DNA polymerase-3 subunit alpha